jgi:Tol biopolymer transport system component
MTRIYLAFVFFVGCFASAESLSDYSIAFKSYPDKGHFQVIKRLDPASGAIVDAMRVDGLNPRRVPRIAASWDNKKLAYFSHHWDTDENLVHIYDSSLTQEIAQFNIGNMTWLQLAFSPDGRRIIHVRHSPTVAWHYDIVLHDIAANTDEVLATVLPGRVSKYDDDDPEKLVNVDNVEAIRPKWAPDGKQISFSAVNPKTGTNSLYVLAVDTKIATPVVDSDGLLMWDDWSPDGSRIAFTKGNADHHWCVYVYEPKSKKLTPLRELDGDWVTHFLSFSPDGKYLLFRDYHYAKPLSAFFIHSFADGSTRMIEETEFIEYPSWSPEGNFISYFKAVNKGPYTGRQVWVYDRLLDTKKMIIELGFEQRYSEHMAWLRK